MPIAVGLKDGAPTPALMKRLTTKLGYHDSVDIQWLLRERLFVEMEGGKEVLKHRFDLASGSQLAIGTRLYPMFHPGLLGQSQRQRAEPSGGNGWELMKTDWLRMNSELG